MKNEQSTLWGLCCFSMLEIQGDLYTFGGEKRPFFNEPEKTRTIFKLSCKNRVCKWSQFMWMPKAVERSHLVAIPAPDSFCN